jgi:hypothetical protein
MSKTLEFIALGNLADIMMGQSPISYEKQRKISSILQTIARTITHTEALKDWESNKRTYKFSTRKGSVCFAS